MSSLEKLYLSGNALRTVPQTIGDLPALDELYLNGNSITDMPRMPKSLTKLYADKNMLIEIDVAISGSPKLEILHVNDNRLVHLPTQIASSLKFIHMARNDMRDVPDSVTSWLDQVAQLQGLRVLEVEDNPCWDIESDRVMTNLARMYH